MYASTLECPAPVETFWLCGVTTGLYWTVNHRFSTCHLPVGTILIIQVAGSYKGAIAATSCFISNLNIGLVLHVTACLAPCFLPTLKLFPALPQIVCSRY